MPSPPSYGCCTRVNFVLKKHLLFQMNLSNSGLNNRSIKEYWLIFTVLKFPLGLQFSHNLTKFKIIKYISTIYIMTTTCIYLQQLTQVSDVAHGPLVNGVGRFVVLSLTPLAIVFKSIWRRLPKTGRKGSNYRRDKNIQTAPIPTYCKQKQVSKLSGNDSSTSQISSKTSR